jgi:NodT family efflux transporter outer membrane factor (OMF) lipoprotein
MTCKLGLMATAATAVVCALSSCASSRGLEPQATTAKADALHANAVSRGVALSPAAWPQNDWWTALGDAQLNALIDEALRGNPSLGTAEARRRAALAQVDSSDADRAPEISGAARFAGAQLPESLVPAPYGGSYQSVEALTLSFSWTPDLWGGQRAAWESAVGSLRAAEVDARAARITLAGDVASSYADLAFRFDNLELARRELQREQQLLELTRQRAEAGLDSRLQLRQAQAAVPVAEQQLRAAELGLAETRLALAALLGAGPDRGNQIERPTPLAATPLALPSVLPADWLARRPDIVSARWRVEAAGHGIEASKSRFYPNLNLSAFAGLASGSLNTLLESDSFLYNLAPSLSLPLFDSGRLRAQLANSDAQYDLAVSAYNERLVAAAREVANNVAQARSLDQQLAAQTQAVQLSQDAYALALERYRGGVGNYLEVLSAQQPLLRAEQLQAQLGSQRLISSIQLIESLGGGFGADGGDRAALEPTHS